MRVKKKVFGPLVYTVFAQVKLKVKTNLLPPLGSNLGSNVYPAVPKKQLCVLAYTTNCYFRA